MLELGNSTNPPSSPGAAALDDIAKDNTARDDSASEAGVPEDSAHDDGAPDDTGNERTPGSSASQPVDGRKFNAWDLASLLLTAFAVLLLMSVAPALGQDWFYRLQALVTLTVLTGTAGVLVVVWAGWRSRRSAAPTGGRLRALWRDPPGTWPAFVLGVIVSLPLLGLYTGSVGADTDSMRLIAAIRHVQRGNLDFLVDTQDSLGPHLLLGPVLTVFGIEGAQFFTLLSMQLLVGSVAWLTYRLSRSMAAAATAALVLLAITPFVDRALVLPMYPAMLALCVLGTWLAYRVVAQQAGWGYALGAGLLVVLGLETQAVGQLVLAIPLLLLITAPELRPGLAGVSRVYTGVGLALLPRIVINVNNGEWAYFRSPRTDYWVTKGYLRQIQEEYLGYDGVGESSVAYLLNFPGRLLTSLGDFGWLALLLAALTFLALRGRARWFALAVTVLIVLAMATTTIQPNSRYFSPFWPGIALLAGVAVAHLIRRRQIVLRLLAGAAVLLLVGMSFHNFREIGLKGQQRADTAERNGYTTATDIIDDGRGIIGVRSHMLSSADIDLPTYGGHLLSEEDYVTYLTWPSDAEVVEMLERNDIGWVMTTKNRERDHDYQDAWLVPNYGLRARQLDMLPESPNFCRINFEARITLYKLGACPDEDEGAN